MANEKQWTYKKSLTTNVRQPACNRVNTTITHPTTGTTWAWIEKSFKDRYVDNGPDQCSGWIGGYHRQGYGMFRVLRSDAASAMMTIQRIAMGRFLGRPLTNDEFVLSECKNLACCNPAHLSIGDESIRHNAANRKRKHSLEYLNEIRDLILNHPTKVSMAALNMTDVEVGNLRATIKKAINKGKI